MAREEGEEDAGQEAGHQALDRRDLLVGRLPQQAAEGDDRGETGKVEEEEGGDALWAQSVLCNEYAYVINIWKFVQWS